ncbi:MAG: hypothetical protein QOG04_294 [Actinomycetota bacterium]|nr:hypothetical protein [Actinomycetota bacterium]
MFLAIALALSLVAAAVFFFVYDPGTSVAVSGSPVTPLPSPSATGHTELTIYDLTPQLPACVDTTTADDGRLPPGFSKRFADIARRVVAMRDLEFKGPVKTKILSPDELSRRAGSEVETALKTDRAGLQEKVLKLLGAIPAGIDLGETEQRLTEQQILGYYLPKTKTIFAPSGGDDGNALSEITLAHELEHALADQQLGLPKLGKVAPGKEEAQYAARALVEGDASLLTQDYLYFALTSDDRVRLGERTGEIIQGLDEDVPYFLERSLGFPYSEGLLFACYLYQKGGWEAVNDAYAHPPQSTAEILFPDRYGNVGPPNDPPDPTAPPGWKHVGRFALGAADLLFIMQEPDLPSGTDLEEVTRVFRWNGGEIHAFERDGDIAIVASLDGSGVPEDGADRDWLCAEVWGWINYRFPVRVGDAGDAHFLESNQGMGAGWSCMDFGPRVVIGPSSDVAKSFLKP